MVDVTGFHAKVLAMAEIVKVTFKEAAEYVAFAPAVTVTVQLPVPVKDKVPRFGSTEHPAEFEAPATMA